MMKNTRQPAVRITRDAGSVYIRTLSLDDRVPKSGHNGLPKTGKEMTDEQKARIIDAFSPENIAPE